MRTFLMIGQSNMAGRGEMGEYPPIVNERVRVLKNGAWAAAREPVNPDRAFAGEGMQLPFADEVQRALGDDVGIVPCAEGGTLLAQWAPGGELFERAAARAREAQAAAPLSAILWIQGENDGYSERNARTYGERFLAMLDALTRAIPAPDDLPVLVADLCPFLHRFNAQSPPEKRVPFYPMISAALRRLPEQRANIRCVRTDGLTGKPDGIHYDTAALRALAKRFAACYLSCIVKPRE